MSEFLDVVSWTLLVIGGAVSVISGIGVLRLPGLFARMHAATMIDTLGAGCVIAGLVLQAGFTVVAFKLVLVFLLLAGTTSTAAHALAKSALAGGVFPLDVDPEDVKAGLTEGIYRHSGESTLTQRDQEVGRSTP